MYEKVQNLQDDYIEQFFNDSPTLVDALDTLKKPKPKNLDTKPLRILIDNYYRIYGVGMVLCG